MFPLETVQLADCAYPFNDRGMAIRFEYEGLPPEFPGLSDEAAEDSGDEVGENGRH